MKLIAAVKNNDLELVKKLINEGYPLDEKDEDNWSPLMFTSLSNRVEIAKELIKAGVSLTEKVSCNKTTLDFSGEIWQSFVIQDLILSMYPDKYSLLEEKVGIHKDILLKLKMKEILDIRN